MALVDLVEDVVPTTTTRTTTDVEIRIMNSVYVDRPHRCGRSSLSRCQTTKQIYTNDCLLATTPKINNNCWQQNVLPIFTNTLKMVVDEEVFYWTVFVDILDSTLTQQIEKIVVKSQRFRSVLVLQKAGRRNVNGYRTPHLLRWGKDAEGSRVKVEIHLKKDKDNNNNFRFAAGGTVVILEHELKLRGPTMTLQDRNPKSIHTVSLVMPMPSPTSHEEEEVS